MIKLKKSKSVAFISLIFSLIFLITAIVLQVPSHTMSFYGINAPEEYVGGDAYNFIIEAAIRGGEISGIMSSKTICFAVSALFILLFFIFYPFDFKKSIDKSNNNTQLYTNIQQSNDTIERVNTTQ